MLANERMTLNEAHAALGVRQKQIRNTIEDGKRFATRDLPLWLGKVSGTAH
jgi:plasmid maintenance system antidote protein VapI